MRRRDFHPQVQQLVSLHADLHILFHTEDKLANTRYDVFLDLSRSTGFKKSDICFPAPAAELLQYAATLLAARHMASIRPAPTLPARDHDRLRSCDPYFPLPDPVHLALDDRTPVPARKACILTLHQSRTDIEAACGVATLFCQQHLLPWRFCADPGKPDNRTTASTAIQLHRITIAHDAAGTEHVARIEANLTFRQPPDGRTTTLTLELPWAVHQGGLAAVQAQEPSPNILTTALELRQGPHWIHHPAVIIAEPNRLLHASGIRMLERLDAVPPGLDPATVYADAVQQTFRQF